MTLKAKTTEEKRVYHREWRKKHPDAIIAAQVRYWSKKAAEMQKKTQEQEQSDQ